MATVTKRMALQALKSFRRRQPQHIPHQDGCTCEGCINSMKATIEEVLFEVNKGYGWHRPVCAACQVEMHPEKNGVGVLDMADYGPVNLWDADLWECPKCGFQIVSGFGSNPIARHYEGERFKRLVQSYQDNSIVIESR